MSTNNLRARSSARLERSADNREVEGSNPSGPINPGSGVEMIIILGSKKDAAAQNIISHLKESFGLVPGEQNLHNCPVKLMEVESDIEQIQQLPPAEEVIVCSRHESASKIPCLTVHVPGRLTEGKLAVASPLMVRSLLVSLKEQAEKEGLDYRVSLEATHHGPCLDLPLTFIEIGSSENRWKDDAAGYVVAAAVVGALRRIREGLKAVGVGGPHYAPRHTEVCLKTKVGIGHILPSYIDWREETLLEAIEKTKDGADLIAADWKGLNASQREIVKEVSERTGIRLIREKSLLREFYSWGENP